MFRGMPQALMSPFSSAHGMYLLWIRGLAEAREYPFFLPPSYIDGDPGVMLVALTYYNGTGSRKRRRERGLLTRRRRLRGSYLRF